MALMILQYRFGRIDHIISDRGSNLIPANLNPSVNFDGEERRLMNLVHVQTPVGGQHSNVVESRIGLVKQFQTISFTQTDLILSSAVHEINNIPILKSDKYVFLTPQQVVNPTLSVSVADIEGDIMGQFLKDSNLISS